jgi:hypothetical protein
MLSILPSVSSPWLVCEKTTHEKNNPNFDHGLATAFIDMINALALHELPLSNRRFTWTN